jgi:multiple sugar transport system ATP-binding protein
VARIQLQQIRKEFGSVVAVKELSLDIPDSKFAALLGPSGCGKTTTMNMIAGLEVPTAGSIWFDDRRIDQIPPGKRGVGFVFQNYAIFTHMSVYDNIAFGLLVRKVARSEINQKVKKVAKLLQLDDLLIQNAGRLSVNDMQKVALGRSMITDPRIFLLDEPFSNLDAAFRTYMRGELKRIQREIGQTMIYVTHDQVEAMSMADNIAVMEFGVLQQFGTPDEIYNQPNNLFVANFIGSPNMNFLECRFQIDDGKGFLLQKNGVNRIAVGDKHKSLLQKRESNEDLILGIRPEHIQVFSEESKPDLLPGTIHFLELLGHKTIVYVRFGGKDIMRAIAPASYRANIAEKVWIELNHAYIHIFDENTGLAIRD